MLEERLRNLDTRVNTTEQTEIFDKNQMVKDIQGIQDEVKILRDRVANIEVDIQAIHRELKKAVVHSEFKEIQKYIELINPILTKFVTKKEVEEVIEEKLADISASSLGGSRKSEGLHEV